jgi:hypothetical protein
MNQEGDPQRGPDRQILFRPRHPGILLGHMESGA